MNCDYTKNVMIYPNRLILRIMEKHFKNEKLKESMKIEVCKIMDNWF